MGSRDRSVHVRRARARGRGVRPCTSPLEEAQENAILDAGAFVAIDRRDRKVGAMLRVLQQQRVPLRTSAAVIAQVWRDGRKQADLSRILTGVDVRALSSGDDKRTGELLAKAKMHDVVDAHVAVMTEGGDRILTSDADDLDTLVRVRGIDATIVAV